MNAQQRGNGDAEDREGTEFHIPDEDCVILTDGGNPLPEEGDHVKVTYVSNQSGNDLVKSGFVDEIVRWGIHDDPVRDTDEVRFSSGKFEGRLLYGAENEPVELIGGTGEVKRSLGRIKRVEIDRAATDGGMDPAEELIEEIEEIASNPNARGIEVLDGEFEVARLWFGEDGLGYEVEVLNEEHSSVQYNPENAGKVWIHGGITNVTLDPENDLELRPIISEGAEELFNRILNLAKGDRVEFEYEYRGNGHPVKEGTVRSVSHTPPRDTPLGRSSAIVQISDEDGNRYSIRQERRSNASLTMNSRHVAEPGTIEVRRIEPETDGGTELHVPDEDCVILTDGGEIVEEESKYEQLRRVYVSLIDEHEEVKSLIRNGFEDEIAPELREYRAKGKKSGLILAIAEIEDLLNDWERENGDDG